MAGETTKLLTAEDLAKNSTRESCWVVVHSKAYDVTEFLPGMTALHDRTEPEQLLNG